MNGAPSLRDDPERAEIVEAFGDLVGDVRAWMEWALLTGGQDWPATPAAPAAVAGLRPDAPPTVPRAPTARPASVEAPVVRGRATPNADPTPASALIGDLPGRARPGAGVGPGAAQQPRGAARDALEATRADIVPHCQRCPRHEGRRNVVFGAGRIGAPIFVVGDQPGPDDDLTAEAWSGKVGRLLTRMLKAIGRAREDAFLTHLVKCRSAGGRDPTRAELDTCRPFLLRQLQAIGPRLVVAAGPLAARLLTGSDAPTTSLRGKVLAFEGVPLVVTLDPAYLLATPRMKAHAWDDLRLIREVLQTP